MKLDPGRVMPASGTGLLVPRGPFRVTYPARVILEVDGYADARDKEHGQAGPGGYNTGRGTMQQVCGFRFCLFDQPVPDVHIFARLRQLRGVGAPSRNTPCATPAGRAVMGAPRGVRGRRVAMGERTVMEVAGVPVPGPGEPWTVEVMASVCHALASRGHGRRVIAVGVPDTHLRAVSHVELVDGAVGYRFRGVVLLR